MTAKETFENLGDYKDSAEKAKEAEQLYQDSLPKIINGPASEEQVEYIFDGGKLTFTEYLYYRVIDGASQSDEYRYFDNINLTLYENPSNESKIEKVLSQYISPPEIYNATFYNASPQNIFTEISADYFHGIYSVAQVKNYLFISINSYINTGGGYGYDEFTEVTHIFDINTGNEVKLNNIADMDTLRSHAVNYAVNIVYEDISYDTYSNADDWENRILHYNWYDDSDDWSVSEASLDITFDGTFTNGAHSEWNIYVGIPIEIFEECLY